MFVEFLEKKESRKLRLLRYLEEQPAMLAIKDTIMSELGLSTFLLNKTLEELSEDFKQLGLCTRISINEDYRSVQLEESSRIDANVLENLYIRRSMGFSMVSTILFGRFDSVEKYANDNFISYPVVYKKLKVYRKELGKLGITVNREFLIEGCEQSIRKYFLWLFSAVYEDDYSYYPASVLKAAEELCQIIFRYIKQTIPLSSRRDLKHFISLSLLRMQQGFFLEKTDENKLLRDFESYDIFVSLDQWFTSKNYRFTEEQKNVEVSELMFFLVALDTFPKSWLSDVVTSDLIKEMNQAFIKGVSREFSVSAAEKQRLNEECNLVHYQALNFSFEVNRMLKEYDVAYFLEVFPEFVDFSKKFISNQKNNTIIWELREVLFLKYLLILINILSLKDSLPPIYIYVDFSYGRLYNELIQKEIKKINDLNIIFDTHVTRRTNLILSDRNFQTSVSAEKIIWISPPRVTDWSHFNEKILEIRKRT
ncbi:helix-turn-helix domain-containing protein [Vagococcus acidifermentans]|uniref:Mga helix-turn-helix domain-containing protein n=1 Tax=Vagococcus acidifermentans TaxID=564710 RepID=A0A430AVI9_9ENTE|nr:helix-turn-helix domain-containing protein [Vagococcus acidifermentans]RSU12084.1 hypothetical protein CBF27_06570 [Vagococcus acidifermentans]